MVSTRLRAFYNPFIGFLPQLGLAAIILVGGRQVINGTISVGDFVAFYGYVVMLVGPMRMLGVSLGMAQRAVASGNRVFEILDREPRLTAPEGADGAAGGRRARADARRVVRLRGRQRARCCATSTWTCRPAGPWPWSAPPARARRRWSMLIPRLYDVDRARSRSTASTCVTWTSESLRHEIALVSDDAFLFSASLRDNIAYARPDATDEEVGRGGRARRPARVRRAACRTATTRWSASAA